MLRQSGETLAGRIAYLDLGPFDVLEAREREKDRVALWLRGGFPDSLLARSDAESLAIRKDFIRTYLERDVPQFGPRLPGETLGRLWTMLAHSQGTMLNTSRLAGGLAVSSPTVTRYIDLLVDLLLVRRLQPFHSNAGKRLVKSPKIYVRDSGLTHALLGIEDHNELAVAPARTEASFYRSAGGAEIDLVLDIPKRGRWAIEIKRGLAARPEKGFHQACEDVRPDRRFLVYSGADRYPATADTEVLELRDMAETLMATA